MNHFKALGSWAQAFVAAAAILSNDYFQTLFKNSNIEKYYVLVLIAVTVVGMKIADLGADLLLDHAKLLRRILAGRDDIEGEWLNVVLDSENDMKIEFVSFCTIEFRKGQYFKSGDNWTLQGAWVQEFSSITSNYSDRELKFSYRTGLNSAGGYGVVRFFPHAGLPSEFVGRFLDDNNKSRYVTRGRRISRKFRALAAEQRRELALGFVEECREKKLLDVKI